MGDHRESAAEPKLGLGSQTPEQQEVLDSFLWAPKFHYAESRFFPKLTAKVLNTLWKLIARIGDFFHGRTLETSNVQIDVEHYHPDRVWYVPSGWSYLRILKPREVAHDDVFVDFGSGKGRVLYQAAQYPFGRVVGVEISAELNQVARQNIEAVRNHLACRQVEIVTADAVEFPIPDDMTIAYFFNPFVGSTFQRVLQNILTSLDRNPRRVRIVYALPLMESAILETGRFRCIRRKRIVYGQGTQQVVLYESV